MGRLDLIEVEHLTKRYGNHVAVEDLSFTVEKGEICGLLGPNGAGKSTTMNILTGYLSATEGTVRIDGIDIFEEPEKAKRKIGYLPEIPPLYTDMTPMEYLRFVTALRKIPRKRREKLIEAAVEKTDIRPVCGRLIRNLSKGYRQRVGLAAALAADPSVIILDEPTVGLDPKQIIEIRELIRELGRDHTVLLSSHILSEVSAVEGIIVETDEDYALSGYPYYLLPEINEHDITGPLIENSLFALAPLAHPIEASGDAADALTVTSLLDTTSGAYCKADAYNADTLDKADGDAEGVFSVAMLSENSEDGSAVLWLSTSAFLDEGTNTIVSGTDSDFMLNAISYLTGYEAGITIHAKSLDSDTLLFSASAGRSVSILFLFVLPVGALAAGFAIWLRRRAR